MSLSHDDAGWIMGKSGATQQKIVTVSGAGLAMRGPVLKDSDRTRGPDLEITGTRKQRRAARVCIELLMQQRRGGVVINLHAPPEGMTGLHVPSDCAAFIVGKGGLVF